MRVVEVARGDDGMRADLAHRTEGLGVLVVLHQPSGRLGREVDADQEDECRNEGRAELQTPGDVACVLDDDIGALSSAVVRSQSVYQAIQDAYKHKKDRTEETKREETNSCETSLTDMP